MKQYPSKLYVETTTRCNLRCSMCVKYSAGACIPETHMSLDTFSSLTPAFAHLESLLLNGIGEPLLTPDLVEMIRMAQKAMPQGAVIGFQTNGLLMTRQKALDLVEAGLNTVCISVDTVSEHGVFHGGEDVGRIEEAFTHLRSAAEATGNPVRIGVEFVLMRSSAESLPRSLEWAAEQGAEFALVTHVLPYAAEMAEQDLMNPNTEESMKEFARWLVTAEEQKMDLADYFTLRWRFYKNRTESEWALVDFVTKRHQAALRRGIPMHLASLMEWTSPEKTAEQAWLASILDTAQSVADRCGLDVTLPPIAARHQRHCDFVEQGVMHITPEGDVRPCYFLWHAYSCVMDGGMKNVQAKTFGNVREEPILDIWNSEAYGAFRQQVLEYDYPYCSNCTVVPCSDITGQGRPFEQDCVGVTVPCGHCVWCMGGVRCLL